MNEMLNLISPSYIGRDKITITIDPVSYPLLITRVITMHFDYSACYPEGVVKPLKLIVQPASNNGDGYFEMEFLRTLPHSFAFTPRKPGQYLILLKETGHNLWQGRTIVDVKGDPFTQIVSSRG